jgi:translation initiation factor 1
MSQQKKFTSLDELKELLSDVPKEQKPPSEKKYRHDGKGNTVHVRIEKKGRKGKIVTVIEGFRHNPQTMEEIATILKRRCGAGGTVKEMTIEVQGDQRSRVAEILREMNYTIKGA